MKELLFICVFLSAMRCKTTGFAVYGLERDTVTITCTHTWASSNRKYFCKNPCSDKDVLIDSVKKSTGRYELKDSGTGVFTIQITQLNKTDTGKYWCGVDRVFGDTYTEVILTVWDALPTSPPPPTSSTYCPTTVPVFPLANISTSNTSNATGSTSAPITSDQPNDVKTTDWKTYLIVFACVLLMILVVWFLAFLIFPCKVCSTCCSRQRQFDVSDYEANAHEKENSPSQSQPSETADSEPDYENIFTATTKYPTVDNIYCNQ
ncbi:CMRF35-like molecule 8 [Salminus brasiliensis]|uniref:CMRF35-like molecule 8 n=1 Tax=Salminus brasiliensis TaxID=930266 RepID=UPI003B836722